MKIILQNNEEDCLLACYTMLLNDLGHKVPLYEVYDKDSLPADGLNVSYLLSLNKRFGVALKAYHASFRDLLQVYNEKKQRIILHWNQDHFVVLDKITEKQVTIVDPAIGRVKYSHDEFLNHYSETIVLINKDENFQTQKYKQIFWKYFKLTLKTKTIILFLLSLVLIQISVLAFSILLRYMLSEKFQFLSSILVLFGVVLFQLLGYFIKNSALNEYNLDFDDNYSKALFQKLLKKPLLYFRNHLSGGISEKINFKSTLRDNVTLKIIPSCVSFISAIVIFTYLITISVRLTIILIIMILVYSVISIILYRKQNEYNQTYLQYLIDFNSELQTDLDDIDYIKIMRREDLTFASWMKINQQVTEKYSQILKFENLSQLVSTIFNYISLSVIIVIAIYYNKYIKVSISDLLVYQTSR